MFVRGLSLYSSFIMKCSSVQIGPALTGARPAPVSPPVLEEDSVQFNKLSYLGCTWVKAPRNEGEAQRAMATLRAESAIPIPITLHVPSGPDGSVRSGTHQDVKQHVCVCVCETYVGAAGSTIQEVILRVNCQ